VLLSGGMDSMSIVAGLVAIGRKPDVITYRLEHAHSKDMATAYRFASSLGLTQHRVILDDSPDSIRALVAQSVALVGSRKTRVECAIPMIAMAEYANRALNASYAVVGDPGVIEDVRAYQVGVNVAGGEETEELRELRLRGFGDVGPGSAAMREAAASRGVTLVGPYALEPIASVALAMEPWRINWPRQKGIALRAFPDVFGTGPRFRFWKPNKSMQTGSGLSDRIAEVYGLGPKQMAAQYRRMETA
jgi:hypothetical protein